MGVEVQLRLPAKRSKRGNQLGALLRGPREPARQRGNDCCRPAHCHRAAGRGPDLPHGPHPREKG
eukprot:12648471-Alexandrium_andersonii.AAC.1